MSPRPSPLTPRAGRVVLVAALVAVAAGALAAAGITQRTTDPDPTVPEQILTLLPEPGSVALRQDEIGADLQPLLTGSLEIDGRPIPLDETDVRELGTAWRVTFRPGDDKTIVELEPGQHTATIYWWPVTQEPPGVDDLPDTPRYSWRFTVQ